MLRRLYCLILLLCLVCVFSFDANAVFRVHPKLNDAFTVSGLSGFLDDIESSTEFHLDATKAASYDTAVDSQKWFNGVTSPASGASKSDYDNFLGQTGSAEGDDPTFNGSVGSADAFWSFGTGDIFDLVSGSNTTFIGEIHKDVTNTGQDFWIIIAFNKTDVTWLGPTFGGTVPFSGADGIHWALRVQETVETEQWGGTTKGPEIVSAVYSPADGDHIFAMSWDVSADTMYTWTDSCVRATHSSVGFRTEGGASAVLRLAGFPGSLTGSLNSETLIYAYAMGNVVMTDAIFNPMVVQLETDHDNDYDRDSTVGACTN